MAEPLLVARGLTVRTSSRVLLRAVDLEAPRHRVVCLMGPSGAGKTTLLRCLNRLVELSPGLRVEGQVFLDGEPIYQRRVDPDALRGRIGMLFQQPVIFPGSIEHNVTFGLRHTRRLTAGERRERAHQALREAALWDEVADRLAEPADQLSVGQQQRLCLARVLSLDPDVLLMDEPTSALDPASTRKIEERLASLKAGRAVVVVTHDPGQAERIADRVVEMALVEGAGETRPAGSLDVVSAAPQAPGLRPVGKTLQEIPDEGAQNALRGLP
ncbi:MAG: ATP-binding cassette domain-containing protein [Acidobacteriota bacterium]